MHSEQSPAVPPFPSSAQTNCAAEPPVASAYLPPGLMPHMREPWPWQAPASLLLLLLLTATVDAISTSSTSSSSGSGTTGKSDWLALRRSNASTSTSDTLEITWLANVTETNPSLLVNLPSTTSTSAWAVTEWKDSLAQLSTIISETLPSEGDMISLELYFRSADTSVQSMCVMLCLRLDPSIQERADPVLEPF